MYPELRVKKILIRALDEHAAIPKTPWDVPAGYYTRSEGSLIFISDPHELRGCATGANMHTSTKAVLGGDETAATDLKISGN